MATVPKRRYASISRRVFSYCAEVFLLFAGILLLQGLLIVLRLNPLVQSVLSGAGLSKGVYHLWLLGTVDLPLILYYTGNAGILCAGDADDALAGVAFGAGERRIRLASRRALLRTLVMLIPFEVNHFFMVWANSPEGIPNRLSLQYAVVGSLILAYMVAVRRCRRGGRASMTG